MPIAVELTLDKQTSEHLRRLWQEVQNLGLKNKTPRLKSHPHITLALYEDEHWDELVKICETFTGRNAPVNIKFDHIGMFNNKHKVLFLAPNVTRELLDLREAWLKLTCNLPTWSKAEGQQRWAPHATLAKRLRAEQAQKALGYLTQQPDLPTKATIAGVHLNQFTEPNASAFFDF